VHHLFDRLSAFFLYLGAPGLLLLGMLDSSFLFLPLGNDLLVVALSARHHDRAALYVLFAAAGSTLGTLFTWWVSRRGGKESLEHSISQRRIAYIECKVNERGGAALAVASLMPPPFPFTPFIMVAGALNYSPRKLVLIVGLCRAARFAILAGLAMWFGKRILNLASQPVVQIAILALVAVSIAGSAYSLWRLFRRSRTRA
jgi:membrane protein YqaA with SNARE-associated domain